MKNSSFKHKDTDVLCEREKKLISEYEEALIRAERTKKLIYLEISSFKIADLSEYQKKLISEYAEAIICAKRAKKSRELLRKKFDESKIREEEIVSLLADDADEYQSLDEQDRQLLREESTDFVIEVLRDICTQIRNGFDAWLSEQTSLSLPEFSEPSQHDDLENPIQDYWIVKRAFSFVLKDTAYDIADVAEKFISSNKIDISLVQTLESLGILEKQDLAKFCAETVFIMGSYLAPSTSKDKLKYEALLIFCLLKGVCQALSWNLEWLDSSVGKGVKRIASLFTIILIGKLTISYYSNAPQISPSNRYSYFKDLKRESTSERFYNSDSLKISTLSSLQSSTLSQYSKLSTVQEESKAPEPEDVEVRESDDSRLSSLQSLTLGQYSKPITVQEKSKAPELKDVAARESDDSSGCFGCLGLIALIFLIKSVLEMF